MPISKNGPDEGRFTPDARLRSAVDAYRLGDTREAESGLADCDRWVASDETRSKALMVLGMAEFELGKLQASLDHLREAADAARFSSKEIQYQTAFALFVRKADFQTPDETLPALARLRQLALATAGSGSLIGLHLAVARLDGLRGLISDAARHISIASRLARNTELTSLRCLTVLVEASITTVAGRPSEARTLASRALVQAQNAADVRLELHAYSLLSLTCLQSNQIDRALELASRVAERSTALLPVRLAALDTIAQARLAGGDVGGAAAALDESNALSPTSDVGRLWNDLEADITRCHLAEASSRWADVVALTAEAEPETERRHLAGLRSSLLSARARALAHLGQLEEAEALLTSSKKTLPRACLDQLVMFHASRGVCSHLRGAWSTADRHFDRAAVIAKSTGRYHLGKWLEQLKEGLPKLSRRAEPSTNPVELAPIERAVSIVSDLQDHQSSLDLVGARILELLQIAGLSNRAVVDQRACESYRNDVEWELLGRRFSIAIHRGARSLVATISAVDDLDELSFLVAVAEAARSEFAATSASAARDLWPQPIASGADEPVFQSQQMQELVSAAIRLASASLPVLITGETGTGKEVLARLVHENSRTSDGPFVPFNCSALPRELVESQLFGHRRGAFTGAIDTQTGIIRAAERGTLFLDEIGDLDPVVQPKLLRFLESGEIHPVGEARARIVSVRVVAATNVDLENLVTQGRFREDLFYRIGVAPVHLPPLRERKDEIPALAAMFVNRYSRECQRSGLRLSDEFVAALLLFDWPGNIRQLGNEIRRAVAMARDGQDLTVNDLAPHIAKPWTERPPAKNPAVGPAITIPLNQSMSAAKAQLEEGLIEYAMDATDGHVSEAAKLLGLSRKGLFLKRRRRGFLRP